MTALSGLNLYKLRDDLETRLVAKAEKHGTKRRAVFQAGVWLGLAFEELRTARALEAEGRAESARAYVAMALTSFALANRRARGSYA